MSSSGITFGGLASGLDTRAIISALLSVERRPITALETKKTAIGKQKSLFGDLNGLLDKLSKAAKSLKTTSSFVQRTATSNNEDILTASANSSATPGTYAVSVVQLAKAQISSASAASDTALLPNSTAAEFVIEAGGNSFVITADANLQDIAAAVNLADDDLETGVRADVIDTGNPDPARRYELVLRATEPGLESAFTVTYVNGGQGVQDLVADLNTGGQVAQNAELTVNGLSVFRSTNTINDLFPGITLDLKSVDPANPEVTITVATNAEETSAKVKDFVDAYNAVVDFVESQNVVSEEGKASSPLFGDTTLRSIRSNLRNIVGGAVTATGNEAFQLLSQIGIKSDTKGRLEFEQSKFEEALATDENAVTAFFTNATNGIAARLEDQIDLYTDSVDGLLKTRSEGFDRLVRQAQDRIEQAERRLTLYEQQLTVKYANLETLLGRLQSQGSAVGNINQNFGNN